MRYFDYPFDKKPSDRFKKALPQLRQQSWERRAKILREENSQPELRAILCSFFKESFLSSIDSALHGDLLVAYAQPLDLIAEFGSAGGNILNYPVHWEGSKTALRLTEYLMYSVKIAYGNDPRLSEEQRQEKRDTAIMRLALAKAFSNFDGKTYSYLSDNLRSVLSDFLKDPETYIHRALQHGYRGIAPPL